MELQNCCFSTWINVKLVIWAAINFNNPCINYYDMDGIQIHNVDSEKDLGIIKVRT